MLLSLLFLCLQAAPFIAAHLAADAEHVFAGFLLNPTDGFSYLAKMRQGFDGAWSFTLPYTAEPGQGAAINLYYLLLGHVARGLGLSLVFTFHAARLLGAAALCAALAALWRGTLKDAWLWALAVALFGSGAGWLVVLGGGFTSDFWVAEMYPFLASFTNAHFPLGLALQIFLITPTERPRRVAWLLAAATAAVVYPFGWAAAAAVVLAAVGLAQFRGAASRTEWQQTACVLAGGLPYALYALWVVNSHPMLAGWNAQNLTPTMPLWDLVVSLSPALILAIPGAYLAFKRRESGMQRLAVWLLVCAVMLYLPFGLQRRMSSGLYVPAVGLAVYALWQALRQPASRRAAVLALVLLALPTNVLILLGGWQASRAQDPALYVHRDEIAAYRWLDAHAAGALLLAPERNSLHAPAFADVRVWYGHPFETVQASQRQMELEAFLHAPGEQPAWLDAGAVTYLLVDQATSSLPALEGWSRMFTSGTIQVWARDSH